MPRLTFIIPAFGESPFLEECINSLKRQTEACEIIVTTSTPNEFILKISEKLNIELLLNLNGGSIAKDWNYAIKQGSGDLIVLAHQDDLYRKSFAKEYLRFHEENPTAGIIFSQIDELIDGQVIQKGKRENVKNILRKIAFGNKKVISDSWAYRKLLGLGCAIPCPAVAFSKKIAQSLNFSDQFSLNLDWATWARLASERVPFGYIPKPLMIHRIHSGAETQIGILEKRREKEDYQLFSQFWPSSVAKFLLVLYKIGY